MRPIFGTKLNLLHSKRTLLFQDLFHFARFDRQLDALLERLDQLTAEVRALNRRLDSADHLAPVVHELRALNESLNALAYAALGQQAPNVRRRRTG